MITKSKCSPSKKTVTEKIQQVSEGKSRMSPLKPLTAIVSGSTTQPVTETGLMNEVDRHQPSTSATLYVVGKQPGSLCSGCDFNMMDEILDMIRTYPKYRGYFSEKIGKIQRLEFLLQNPSERAKGETTAFLRNWIKYFSRQIFNVMQQLRGINKNGNSKTN